jgi:hypothetical protein
MPSNSCTDHKGATFRSEKEMCAAHSVSKRSYVQRKHEHKGWPVKWLLFGKPVIDYLENEFKSQKEMCDFHGIGYELYLARRRVNPEVDLGSFVLLCKQPGPRLSETDIHIAAEFGIDRYNINSRMGTSGWSKDEAIGISGRGLAYRLMYGHVLNSLVTPIEISRRHKTKRCVNYLYVGEDLQPYFAVQIGSSGKYSIMNADEILAFDGSTPELLFDTYIWD